MKDLRKKDKMLFSMVKHPSSNRELKKIKTIRTKESSKREFSSSSISISNSVSPLYSDSKKDKRKQPDKWKDIKKLDHILASDGKNDNQCNDAIEYDPEFDNNFSWSSGTKETFQ